MSSLDTLTPQENLHTWLDSSILDIEKYLNYLRWELEKIELNLVNDTKRQREEQKRIIVLNTSLQSKKNDILIQIEELESILVYLFDEYPKQSKTIKWVVRQELAELKELRIVPENHTLTEWWVSSRHSRNEKIISRIHDQIHQITAIKISLLKDRIDEEHTSMWRHIRNRKPESLRDLVEVSIQPILWQVALTEEWIATFDRGLDMIAHRYLDDNLSSLIENKYKHKSKKTPKWQEAFDESKFMAEWFDMTKEEFTTLVKNSLQDADKNVLNIFTTYSISVKLQWKIVTIDPIEDINVVVSRAQEKRNTSEYSVEPWDMLWVIVFRMMDQLPITQAQLSWRLSKLEGLPGIHAGDIISREWNIFTINKLSEDPYKFKIWPNNGNAMIV